MGTELVRRFMVEMNKLGWRVEWTRLYGSLQDSVVIVIPSAAVEVEELTTDLTPNPFPEGKGSGGGDER